MLGLRYIPREVKRFDEFNKPLLTAMLEAKEKVWHPDQHQPLPVNLLRKVKDPTIVEAYVTSILTFFSNSNAEDSTKFRNSLHEQIMGKGENLISPLGYSRYPLCVRNPIFIKTALHSSDSRLAYSRMVWLAGLEDNTALPPLSDDAAREIQQIHDELLLHRVDSQEAKAIEVISQFLVSLNKKHIDREIYTAGLVTQLRKP